MSLPPLQTWPGRSVLVDWLKPPSINSRGSQVGIARLYCWTYAPIHVCMCTLRAGFLVANASCLGSYTLRKCTLFCSKGYIYLLLIWILYLLTGCSWRCTPGKAFYLVAGVPVTLAGSDNINQRCSWEDSRLFVVCSDNGGVQLHVFLVVETSTV